MDEITKLLKDLILLLQTIAEAEAEEEEECCELLKSVKMSELKREFGPWFIADYPLYQGS